MGFWGIDLVSRFVNSWQFPSWVRNHVELASLWREAVIQFISDSYFLLRKKKRCLPLYYVGFLESTHLFRFRMDLPEWPVIDPEGWASWAWSFQLRHYLVQDHQRSMWRRRGHFSNMSLTVGDDGRDGTLLLFGLLLTRAVVMHGCPGQEARADSQSVCVMGYYEWLILSSLNRRTCFRSFSGSNGL